MANVLITPDFRLVTEDTGYVLERRYIVDPTKAPGFEARYRKALLAGEELPDSEPYEKWREHKYYPLTAGGLASALEYVTLRTAGAEATTIGELLAAYRDEAIRLRVLISQEVSAND